MGEVKKFMSRVKGDKLIVIAVYALLGVGVCLKASKV